MTLCKNCKHELEEVEAPDFNGDTHNIWVHKNQKIKGDCMDTCICGCYKSVVLLRIKNKACFYETVNPVPVLEGEKK